MPVRRESPVLVVPEVVKSSDELGPVINCNSKRVSDGHRRTDSHSNVGAGGAPPIPHGSTSMTVAQDHQDSPTPSLLRFRRTNCKAAQITQEGCQGGHLQPGSDSEEHLVRMQIERQPCRRHVHRAGECPQAREIVGNGECRWACMHACMHTAMRAQPRIYKHNFHPRHGYNLFLPTGRRFGLQNCCPVIDPHSSRCRHSRHAALASACPAPHPPHPFFIFSYNAAGLHAKHRACICGGSLMASASGGLLVRAWARWCATGG